MSSYQTTLNDKSVCINVLHLCYRELLYKTDSSSVELCKIALGCIRNPFGGGDTMSGQESLSGLITIARDWCNKSPSFQVSESMLVQSISSVLDATNNTNTEIINAFKIEYTDEESRGYLLSGLRGTLLDYIAAVTARNMMGELYGKLADVDDRDSLSTFVEEVKIAVDEYVYKYNTRKEEKNAMAEVDLADSSALAEVLKLDDEARSLDGVMVQGYQGLNRMCGANGGFRRGDTVLYSGLPYNYKSGCLLDAVRHTVMYNKPFMIDPEKKPLVIHISLENNTTDNVGSMEKRLYELEFGKPVDEYKTTHTIEERTAFIHARMSVNGYTTLYLRKESGVFNIADFEAMVISYEKKGYEIHMIALDYALLLSVAGIEGQSHEQKRMLLRRLRTITNSRFITLVTAAQLSTEAKRIVRDKKKGFGSSEPFVKLVSGGGYYADCSGLDQEVDLEISLSISVVNKDDGSSKSYLEYGRGKHRGVDDTPERHKYFVMPFGEVGGLHDDVVRNKDGDIEMLEKNYLNSLTSGDDIFTNKGNEHQTASFGGVEISIDSLKP